MPFKYTWIDNRFYCIFNGIVTWEDFYSATSTLYGASKFDISNEILIEIAESAKIIVTERNAQEIAYLDKAASRYNSKLRMAIIAEKPEARAFALKYIEIAKQIGVPWVYKLFDRHEDADAWFTQVSKKSDAQKIR